MIEEGVSNRGVANLNGEDNQICLLGDCLFISTLTTWGRGGVRWRGGRGGEGEEKTLGGLYRRANVITTVQCSIIMCSICSQLNNKPRVVVTDIRLHHTCTIIIILIMASLTRSPSNIGGASSMST